MNLRKNFFSYVLLSLAAFLLCSCSDDADFSKHNITKEKIKRDLEGQTITAAELQVNGPTHVALKEVINQEGHAVAQIFLKAINPKQKTGIEGDFELIYKYQDGNWIISTVTPIQFKKMNNQYSSRLSELVEFPLHFAAAIGDIEQAERVLAEGTPVNTPESKKLSTALMFASERGYLDIVQKLIESGAEINYQNKFGYTALHAASAGGHFEIVKLLINEEAEVDARDKSGRTPLLGAAENDSQGVARLLLENGAEPNAAGPKSWTPLYASVAKGSLEVAELLIEKGAEVNTQAEEGVYSPLLLAAYNNNAQMVKLLLEAGADTSAILSNSHTRDKGATAIELAKQQGHEEIVEILSKWSSKKKL